MAVRFYLVYLLLLFNIYVYVHNTYMAEKKVSAVIFQRIHVL